jgi:hypothetical protein
MPRKLIGLQFLLTLALAMAVSGCGSSDTADAERETLRVRIRDVGHLYNDYLAKHQKPPTRPEDLQDVVDKSETKKIVQVLTDGRITVIWNAMPREQEENTDTFVLLYETNPGPSGKRWVYLAKRGKGAGETNRWVPNLATTAELTAEEFEKAVKAKPTP